MLHDGHQHFIGIPSLKRDIIVDVIRIMRIQKHTIMKSHEPSLINQMDTHVVLIQHVLNEKIYKFFSRGG
jgi:hypothetical protein